MLILSRSTAGTLQSPALKLTPLGTTTYFTPCAASTGNPLCAGPARIQMVLASAPSVIVAETVEFTLVAPSGVGSTAPCDPYAQALFFDGSGYIFELVRQLRRAQRRGSAPAAGVPDGGALSLPARWGRGPQRHG